MACLQQSKYRYLLVSLFYTNVFCLSIIVLLRRRRLQSTLDGTRDDEEALIRWLEDIRTGERATARRETVCRAAIVCAAVARAEAGRAEWYGPREASVSGASTGGTYGVGSRGGGGTISNLSRRPRGPNRLRRCPRGPDLLCCPCVPNRFRRCPCGQKFF